MVTNALITLLTVYHIWKISTEIEEVNPGASRPYRLIIAILLESGLTLFIAQLLLLVLWSTGSVGFPIVGGVITQLYVSVFYWELASSNLTNLCNIRE